MKLFLVYIFGIFLFCWLYSHESINCTFSHWELELPSTLPICHWSACVVLNDFFSKYISTIVFVLFLLVSFLSLLNFFVKRYLLVVNDDLKILNGCELWPKDTDWLWIMTYLFKLGLFPAEWENVWGLVVFFSPFFLYFVLAERVSFAGHVYLLPVF